MENISLDSFIYKYITPPPKSNTKAEDMNTDKPENPAPRDSDSTWKSYTTAVRKNSWLKTHLIAENSDIESINSETDIRNPKFYSPNRTRNHESANVLIEQLLINGRKCNSYQNYYQSLKSHLKDLVRSNITEIETEKNAVIAEINFKYENMVHKLKSQERLKIEIILDKEKDIVNHINKIERLTNKIENRINSDLEMIDDDLLLETINYLRNLTFKNCSIDKETLKPERVKFNWQEESDFNRAFIKTIDFNYNKKESKSYHKGKLSQESTRESPRHKRSSTISNSNSREIKISPLFSDETKAWNLKNNQVRIYVPYGYPEYSCFYILTIAIDTSSKEIVSYLKSFIDTEENYKIFIQKSNYESAFELKNHQCPLGMLQNQYLGWPRLLIKR